MGLPPLWITVAAWLAAGTVPVATTATTNKTWERKNAEIPILPVYNCNPEPEFWDSFPNSKDYFKKRSPVNYKMFRKYVNRCWVGWNRHERAVAKKALRNLRQGAFTRLNRELGAQKCRNAKSAEKFGAQMTDTLATWIKRGFVRGPFNEPPGKLFRENPLMAVEQPTKIRPIMNLSAPKGRSFNEAVDMNFVKKLRMSTPRKFGELLLDLGGEGVMSKYDISDAYKLIKTHKSQWGCFGFKWLGKYFYDSTTVFGSRAAPEKFDSLPETVVNMCCFFTKMPKKWVHRQLDDVPFAAPRNSGLAEKFGWWYEKICKDCNIPLAGFCEQKEKAFRLEKEGTVLGVVFNSEQLTWRLANDKASKINQKIGKFCKQKACGLREVQSLHGKLNDFAQMATFMKGYRYNLLALLRSFGGDEKAKRLITGNLRKDLRIWANCVEFARQGLPIPETKSAPPIRCVEYATDAAGAAYQWEKGEGKNISVPGDRGVACIGYDDDTILSTGIMRWPDELIFENKDAKGTNWGSKTTALELIGVMMPFLFDPKSVQNRPVRIICDNLAVIIAWEKRYCKNDPETSVLVRALHEIVCFLECDLYLCHVKRLSTPMAAMADRLSRLSTTTSADWREMEQAKRLRPSGAITKWLRKPVVDWDLGKTLINEISQRLYK